jgi:ArsR family transcriptional regulator, arsenate/arsenite/antimonite-responsive transcriptional repressor
MESKAALAALAALAQETRLAIFRLLVEAGPTGMAVGEIGAALKIAPATLSFHLKELANAGLLSSRQDGRYIFYSTNYPQMNALVAFLTENCCALDGGRPACGPASRSTRGDAAINRKRSKA